jgi:excisionase family DNA binding protein
MTNARKSPGATHRSVHPALTVNIDLDPLVEVVRRHVKLSVNATRLIKGDLARLLQTPAVISRTGKATVARSEEATDPVLSTQAAADLVGVSRPYLVARIDAGDLPLHQQVGNQRRVLQSAVLSWHRKEQTRRRKALGRLGADLDAEIFKDRSP